MKADIEDIKLNIKLMQQTLFKVSNNNNNNNNNESLGNKINKYEFYSLL